MFVCVSIVYYVRGVA